MLGVEVDVVETEGAGPEKHTQSGRSYNWTDTLPSSNREIGNKMPCSQTQASVKKKTRKNNWIQPGNINFWGNPEDIKAQPYVFLLLRTSRSFYTIK